MISDIVDTGTRTIALNYNKYKAGDTVSFEYRHGATPNSCSTAAWNNYVAPFASLGYVQIRLIVYGAKDSGSNGVDALYQNVTKGGPTNRAYFNGVNSYININTPAFRSLFNGDECTIVGRWKVYSSDYFDESVDGHIVSLGTDTLTCYFQVNKDGPGGLPTFEVMIMELPTLRAAYDDLDDSDTIWETGGAAWSKSGNEFKMFRNGVQFDTTRTMPSSWVGNLYRANIGMQDEGLLSYPWHGWLSDIIIGLGVRASDADMLTLDTKMIAETLTTSDLDTIFGAGNYIWWKLDES